MAQVILLVADRSMRRSPALEAARRTAAASGASIHVLLLAHSSLVGAAARLLPGQGRLAREGWLAQLGQLLAQECAALRGAGIEVTAELAWSTRPAQDILLRVQALKPRLVVMDAAETLSERRCERRLLRECPATLWLARGEGAAPPARIAVAVDPERPWPADTVFGQQLLRTGLDLAQQYGAECEVLHVAHEPPGAAPDPALDQLAAAAGITAGHRHALAGPVVDALTGYAAGHGIDLLVLGGESRPGWKRRLLGNKLERINRCLGCDLLVVRPAADAPAPHPEPQVLPRAA